MQFGENDFDAGQAGPRLGVDRDTSTIVADLDGPVCEQVDLNGPCVTAQRFIDRVVDNFP